jgi:ribosomal protein S18 acetylase RimI-like enzyme
MRVFACVLHCCCPCKAVVDVARFFLHFEGCGRVQNPQLAGHQKSLTTAADVCGQQVLDLAVDPAHQNRGLGKALLRHMMNSSR